MQAAAQKSRVLYRLPVADLSYLSDMQGVNEEMDTFVVYGGERKNPASGTDNSKKTFSKRSFCVKINGIII